MRKIKIICFLAALIISITSVYAQTDIENIPFKENYIKPCDNIDVSEISLFSENTASDITPVCAYKNEDNKISAFYVEFPDNLSEGDVSVSINGQAVNVNSSDTYQSMDYFPKFTYYYIEPVVCNEHNIIAFSNEDTYVEYELNIADIVEAEEGFTADASGHVLNACSLNDEVITVPNMYNGKIISEISGRIINDGFEGAFLSEGIQTENVIISDGISIVGNFCFTLLDSIKFVTLPDTTMYIGGYCFYGTSVEGDIVLPPHCRSILSTAYAYTPITSIKLNDGIQRLMSQAFYSCSKLKTVNLPESLSYIGSNAFVNCKSLSGELVIPGGISEVKEGTFFDCSSISSVVIKEGIVSLGALSFGGSSLMSFSTLSLPSTLKRIGPYCFQNCKNVEELTLPSGLQTISDGAFDHMSGIKNSTFTIPSSVKTIGGDYDRESENFIRDENTGYGGHVFYDMGGDDFTEFIVEDGNEYFTAVDGVLYDKSLTRLVAYPRGIKNDVFELPEGITQLDELSFSRNNYLKTLILPNSYILNKNVPQNVLNTNANSLSAAIYTHTGINEIRVKDTNPNYSVINGCLYSKDKKVLWYVPNKTQETVVVEDGTEVIEKGTMFLEKISDVSYNKVIIPSSVTYIDPLVTEALSGAGVTVVMEDNGYYYINEGKLKLKGDINGDGKISSVDVSLGLKYIFNGKDINLTAADINNDSNITLTDMIIISTRIA